jgi:hypothetical protein
MKTIKLKSLITESERGSILYIQLANENGYGRWFLEKIDSTHFKMADNEKTLKTSKAYVSNIDQHKDKSYYNDVRDWLDGKYRAPQLNGKKYK